MELQYGLISVDDHVQEMPDLWTQRLSRARWGDRIPHLAKREDGSEYWVVDGQALDLPGVARAGAGMPDRALEPQTWAAVPPMAYDRSPWLVPCSGQRRWWNIYVPTTPNAVWALPTGRSRPHLKWGIKHHSVSLRLRLEMVQKEGEACPSWSSVVQDSLARGSSVD